PPHLAQVPDEIRPLGLVDGPARRRHRSPLLSGGVGLVPDDRADGRDTRLAHAQQLAVDLGCDSRLVVVRDDAGVVVGAAWEADVRVVDAEERLAADLGEAALAVVGSGESLRWRGLLARAG